jgi:hypothetical protein
MTNLHKVQRATYYVYMNGTNKPPASHKQFTNGEKITTKFCFAINIGSDQKGKTYMGNDQRPGNHWSLCHIDLAEKIIVYGDSLGWESPRWSA